MNLIIAPCTLTWIRPINPAYVVRLNHETGIVDLIILKTQRLTTPGTHEYEPRKLDRADARAQLFPRTLRSSKIAP